MEPGTRETPERSGRGLMFASDAIVWLGVGVLLHRVFLWLVLGLGWTVGRPGNAIAEVAVVMVGCGMVMRERAARRPQRPSWWARAPIGATALATGVGIAYALVPTLGRLELHDRELAGVTIGLPDGKVDEDRGGPFGKVLVKEPGGFEAVVGVSWQAGTIDD